MSKATTTGTTDLPDRPTFEQAAAAAIAEHSPAAAADETSDDDADASADADEQADADGASTQDDDDAASGDDADDQDADAEAEPAPGETKPATTPSGLLTDEEFRALQTKHANDPVKLRKELEKTFTQKTQQLATDRKRTERLEQYADIVDAYETDPEGTVRALAKELGIAIAESPAAPDEATRAAATAAEQTKRVEGLVTKFREKLGPELDYLADALAPAILDLVRDAAKPLIDEEVQPLKTGLASERMEKAQATVDETLATFKAAHADYDELEPRMNELAQRMLPAKGMTQGEYVAAIYRLAKAESLEKDFDTKVKAEAAKQAKAAITGMEKGARNTDRTRSTPERTVKAGPAHGRVPTFEEAAAAASRGERWE